MLSCTVMMQIHRYRGVLFVQVFSVQLCNLESVPVVPVCGKLYIIFFVCDINRHDPSKKIKKESRYSSVD